MKLSTILSRLDACPDAREWAKAYPDLQSAWTACQRSNWMLWLLRRTVVDPNDPRYRLIAYDCAEAILHFVPVGEDRLRRAIEVARRFARGEATREELDAVGAAAWDAARAAQSDIVRRYFPECPEIKPESRKR